MHIACPPRASMPIIESAAGVETQVRRHSVRTRRPPNLYVFVICFNSMCFRAKPFLFSCFFLPHSLRSSRNSRTSSGLIAFPFVCLRLSLIRIFSLFGFDILPSRRAFASDAVPPGTGEHTKQHAHRHKRHACAHAHTRIHICSRTCL